MSDQPNLVGGRYALIRQLAVGGMAEVWLARQTGLEGFEKLVVVKRILPHYATNPDFVRMLRGLRRSARAVPREEAPGALALARRRLASHPVPREHPGAHRGHSEVEHRRRADPGR